MRLYTDSAPVIYYVERVPLFLSTVATRMNASGVVLVASQLTRLECRIDPLRKGDGQLLNDFDRFFRRCRMARLTNAVYERAALIRTQNTSIETPDAIHLAAAIESRCDVFYTNDHRLARFTGMPIEVV